MAGPSSAIKRYLHDQYIAYMSLVKRLAYQYMSCG
jgi:hypothetical protein